MSVEEKISRLFPKVHIIWLHLLKQMRDVGLSTACLEEEGEEIVYVEFSHRGWKIGASMHLDQHGVACGVDITSGERGQHHSHVGFSCEDETAQLNWQVDHCLSDPLHEQIMPLQILMQTPDLLNQKPDPIQLLTEKVTGRPANRRFYDVTENEAHQIIDAMLRLYLDAPPANHILYH